MYQPTTQCTHRLDQDVVFAVQEVYSGVLVQRLHVLPCRSSKAIFGRAPARVPLADLAHTHRHGRGGSAGWEGLYRSPATHEQFHLDPSLRSGACSGARRPSRETTWAPTHPRPRPLGISCELRGLITSVKSHII